jgi:transcriptional regulator with XRE-family HTH domain
MTYISDLERGARSPGLAVQQRLASALGVMVWELMKIAEEGQDHLKEREPD